MKRRYTWQDLRMFCAGICIAVGLWLVLTPAPTPALVDAPPPTPTPAWVVGEISL